MQASQTRLVNLIGGPRQFQVPLYQRTYSWVKRNLQTLWSDILIQAALVDEGSAGSHFLGSIVQAPSPTTEAAFPRLLVIDGQQRLTRPCWRVGRPVPRADQRAPPGEQVRAAQ
jgi:uncharacterized protein with ParB-like and HNH nuclease domain